MVLKPCRSCSQLCHHACCGALLGAETPVQLFETCPCTTMSQLVQIFLWYRNHLPNSYAPWLPLSIHISPALSRTILFCSIVFCTTLFFFTRRFSSPLKPSHSTSHLLSSLFLPSPPPCHLPFSRLCLSPCSSPPFRSSPPAHVPLIPHSSPPPFPITHLLSPSLICRVLIS